MPRLRIPALLAPVAALGCFQLPLAHGDTHVALHASFSRGRSASLALTFELRFVGGPEGLPSPLRTIVLQLPAALRIQARGANICTRVLLTSRGPAGCPATAVLGRGHAILEVHAGSQTIPEQAVLWAFLGPYGSGAQLLEIIGVGSTPLDERVISTVTLRREHVPLGSQITLNVPTIPTVELEPDASFDVVSLTLGANGSRAHAGGARVTLAGRCPAFGLPFAASVRFADGASSRATAVAPCP